MPDRDERRVSVDLGGSSVRVAVGSLADGIERSVSEPIDSTVSPAAVFDMVFRSIREFDPHPERVGFAFPGLLDNNGRVVRAPNLSEAWRGLSVQSELHKLTGLPVAVGNDARVAAIGELTFGEWFDEGDQERATLAYIGLGTGVGGGVVINGKLHVGCSKAAGELGHVIVEIDGQPCACGGRGCVETIAGGAALVAAARRLCASGKAPRLADMLVQTGEKDRARLDVALIAAAARAGDDELDRLLDRAAVALGALCVNLVYVLSPDVIVFGGGIAALGRRLLDPVWETVRERAHMVSIDTLQIETSRLEGQSGLLGALVLAGTAR